MRIRTFARRSIITVNSSGLEAVRLLPAEELIILISSLGPNRVKPYTVDDLFS